MEKPTVYVETSVISYLTARPSRDVITAGRQLSTVRFWDRRDEFHLVASEMVVREASRGNPILASRRLEVLDEFELLSATDTARRLSTLFLAGAGLPEKAAEDALHIAIAAASGIEFLVTWNFAHMANAAIRRRVEEICRDEGFDPVIICTPQELLAEDDDPWEEP
ncbi:MAG: type II toxin-antitoxin system VapC family toxin [Planctomycetaceae bacterium]